MEEQISPDITKLKIKKFCIDNKIILCSVKRTKHTKIRYYRGKILEIKKFYFVIDDEDYGNKMIFYSDLLCQPKEYKQKGETE